MWVFAVGVGPVRVGPSVPPVWVDWEFPGSFDICPGVPVAVHQTCSFYVSMHCCCCLATYCLCNKTVFSSLFFSFFIIDGFAGLVAYLFAVVGYPVPL